MDEDANEIPYDESVEVGGEGGIKGVQEGEKPVMKQRDDFSDKEDGKEKTVDVEAQNENRI